MITGGQNYVSSPPAFSNDTKKLLVCTGNTVSVFSTVTGMLVTELEGHTGRVTSIVVVPTEMEAAKLVNCCWTSSLDGTIFYWDFSVPEMLRRIDVKLPIHSMVIPNISSSLYQSSKKNSNLYAVISVECTRDSDNKHNVSHGRIQICDLTHSGHCRGFMTETKKPDCITISSSNEYLGICNKRKIHIWKFPTKDFKFNDVKMIKLKHTKSISVLAFHPTERIVAGGDTTGRILIWRGFGSRKFLDRMIKGNSEEASVEVDDDGDLSPTTWHWHSSKVKFLSFSSDGAYLYSGGNEGVIVVWQLETGIQKFKPRLGSPLLFFVTSPDSAVSCVSCADNQIHLLKMPSMEISKSISGIKLPFSHPEVHKGWANRLAYDHSAGIVALRTENFCIQFYSLFDNQELSQVQVCERNYQPVDEVTIIVTELALSVDASIMATVEVKLPEEDIVGFVILKFWTRGSQTGKYALSTVIYEPHSDAGISALAFHPNNQMAVSSSFGGDFKIWVNAYGKIEEGFVQKSGWRCQSIGSYKKKPLTAAAFSADGSVLALASETVVTLWDPNTNSLVAIMGETITPIVKLSFVGKSDYLVTMSHGSNPQLATWDLSKLAIHWSYRLHGEAISSNGDGSQFAVLSKISAEPSLNEQDGIILLFDIENPVPLATWSVKKANGGGLAFVRPSHLYQGEKTTDEPALPSMLAYINSDHEYVIFDPCGSANPQSDLKNQEKHIPSDESEPFGYASIYGELSKSTSKRDCTEAIPFVPLERPWETIFSGSSHVLPPLSNLCCAFLESLLEKRTTVKE